MNVQENLFGSHTLVQLRQPKIVVEVTQVLLQYTLLMLHWFCSPLAPSGFPQNFLAVATSPRSILLTWILPLPWDRNGIITGYLINATLVETGEMLQQSSNSTSLVMNARPYTTYLFIIAAVTVAGRGPFSTEISIKTPESGKTVLSAQLKP